MRDLLLPLDHGDLVEGADLRGEPPVDAEDAALDAGSEGEVVEDVGTVLSDVGVAVLALALLKKAVDLRDLAGFVVPAEEGDAGGVAGFEAEEVLDRLDRVGATVDEVPDKHVRCVRDLAALAE